MKNQQNQNQKLTPYDIEMRNFDEVPRGILKEAKKQIKDNDAGTR